MADQIKLPKLSNKWTSILLGVLVVALTAVLLGKNTKFDFFGLVKLSTENGDPVSESPITSAEVINFLKAGEADGQEEILAIMANFEGVFDKSQHSLRDFKSTETVDEMSTLEEDHIVRQSIIDDCMVGKGVCETSYRDLYVAWPGNQKSYNKSKAYVCNNSNMFQKTIIIANLNRSKAVILPATGRIGLLSRVCNDGVDAPGGTAAKDNFVQLSNEHLKCLLGNQSAAEFNKLSVKQTSPQADDFTPSCIDI